MCWSDTFAISHHSACLPLLSLKDFKGESRSPSHFNILVTRTRALPHLASLGMNWSLPPSRKDAGAVSVDSQTTGPLDLCSHPRLEMTYKCTEVSAQCCAWAPRWVALSFHSSFAHDESTDTSDFRRQRLMFGSVELLGLPSFTLMGTFSSHTRKKPEYPDLQALAGLLDLDLSHCSAPSVNSVTWLQTFLLPCSQPW